MWWGAALGKRRVRKSRSSEDVTPDKTGEVKKKQIHEDGTLLF